MHEIYIPELDKRFFLPASLENFTTEQYIYLCELLLMLESKSINFHQFKFLLTIKLLRFKRTQLMDERVLDNLQLIANVFDSLFTITEQETRLNIDFTHNPIPKHKGLRATYYGPYDYFRNISWGEFVQGLSDYYYCLEDMNLENLSRLFKVFYRKKNPKYFFRRSKNLINSATDIRGNKPISKKKTRYIHPGALFGFFLYFKDFHEKMSNSIMQVEGQDIDFSILFSDTTGGSSFKSDIPGLGMKGVTFHIANKGGLGDLKEVNKLPMWEVLLYLYDMKKEEIDQEKFANEQKKNEKQNK